MTENNFPPHSKPVAVARQLTEELFTEKETSASILRWWRNGWWQFTGTAWEEVTELDVKQPIWERLETATCVTDRGVKDWEPNTARIRGLMEPLQIVNRLRDSIDAPTWLDGRSGNAADLISLANGTVNVKSGEFKPGHDAALFTTWSLPFDFDNMASCPTWEAFLREVFNHDPNGAQSLQEFAGYLISGRTDLQKGLLLVGPPGGGKGTISRTLQQLMGLSNCVSPSLSSLGGEFGMEDLIGKPLAVIEDARQEFGARTSTTVERLLSIIGEDAVSVNRKNRSFWNGHLPTRFLMVSNEMPRLSDPSGAILRRFVAIELTQSFANKPDTTLGQRINKELPGIFLWALQGLARLNAQQRFTVPDTQADALELMSDIGSPTKSYFTDEIDYIITKDSSDIVPVKEVHARYKQWCEETGIYPIPQNKFVQEVKAANLGIRYKNTRENGEKKQRLFYGLRLTNLATSWLSPQGEEENSQ